MEKQLITYEQLLAGALLMFERVDNYDMTLLMEEFNIYSANNVEFKDYEIKQLLNYIQVDRSSFKLKDQLTFDSSIGTKKQTIKDFFESIQGQFVSTYLSQIDLDEFVLRKIRLFSSLDKDDINNYFNPKQQKSIENLLALNYVNFNWNDNIPHEDFQELGLTQNGKIVLFKKDYSNIIEAFLEALNLLRYDVDLLDDFLAVQDLDKNPYEILSIVNFDRFCNIYDRNPRRVREN